MLLEKNCLNNVINDILINRKHDDLFTALLDVCANTKNYILNDKILNILMEYFSTLSTLLAYKNVLKIAALIETGKSPV